MEEMAKFFENEAARRKVRFFQNQFGGWERWFQMEFAWYIQETYGNKYDVALEVRGDYINNLCRSDIHLTGRSPRYPETILELKCETVQTNDLSGLMEMDIQKRLQLTRPDVEYESIALAIRPRSLNNAQHTLSVKYPGKILVRSNPNWPVAGILSFFDVIPRRQPREAGITNQDA